MKPGSSSFVARRGTAESTRSLEERLHAIRQGCRLMGDVFDMLGQAAILDAPFRMSGQGCNVLADLCRTFADDLDELLNSVPGEMANWSEETHVGDRSGRIAPIAASPRRAEGGSRPRQRRAQRAKS